MILRYKLVLLKNISVENIFTKVFLLNKIFSLKMIYTKIKQTKIKDKNNILALFTKMNMSKNKLQETYFIRYDILQLNFILSKLPTTWIAKRHSIQINIIILRLITKH